MIVEINRSSLSEIYQVVLRSPARKRQSSSIPSREPEKADLVDDEDLAPVASPPLSRWPPIFPSL